MGLLTRERSPQAEARRQAEILTEVERQRLDRREAERALTQQNRMARERLWQNAAETAEQRRMEAAAAELATKRAREARQREQEAEQNRLKMEDYKSAKAAFDGVKRELDALNVPHDLSTPEGLAAATEQRLRATALRELLAQADRRLILAERAVGRHRNGGI